MFQGAATLPGVSGSPYPKYGRRRPGCLGTFAQGEHWMRRVLQWCAVLVVLGSCVRNPVSGKKQLSFISESQEVQLGQQSAEEVRQSIGLYADPKAQAYVAALGQRLAQASERPKLPWSFQVVDDSSVNAFALP